MDRFSDELSASFPLTEFAPWAARHWLSARAQFPDGIHDRVVLLLSELVANSVRHSGLAAPEEVDVEVHPIPGGLHVEVVDHGVGIDEPVPFKPDHFGLRFVDTQSDRWGFRNDPTRVWFEINGGSR
jgi:anti-sigma regulatory factor (Ser/Thr protein kinase)